MGVAFVPEINFERLAHVKLWLPARASDEQGNVIGLVSVYIVVIKKKL